MNSWDPACSEWSKHSTDVDKLLTWLTSDWLASLFRGTTSDTWPSWYTSTFPSYLFFLLLSRIQIRSTPGKIFSIQARFLHTLIPRWFCLVKLEQETNNFNLATIRTLAGWLFLLPPPQQDPARRDQDRGQDLNPGNRVFLQHTRKHQYSPPRCRMNKRGTDIQHRMNPAPTIILAGPMRKWRPSSSVWIKGREGGLDVSFMYRLKGKRQNC